MIVSTLAACLPDGVQLPKEEKEGVSDQVTTGDKVSHSGKVLRTRNRGAVEVAFDDEDSYIVAEVIAAKICRGVVDIRHKVLSR